MTERLRLQVLIENGPTVTVSGRNAWTLLQLIDAGSAGCTPIERPAPRWSHYIAALRGIGFVIETIHERHGGAFPGNHGRYVLRSKVTVLADSRKEAA